MTKGFKPKNGVFSYSPDIKVFIQSANAGKVLDVSKDVMSFQVTRATNATSTASISLSNSSFKYTPSTDDDPPKSWNGNWPIETMDGITIYLKRTKYIQVFTGFIT